MLKALYDSHCTDIQGSKLNMPEAQMKGILRAVAWKQYFEPITFDMCYLAAVSTRVAAEVCRYTYFLLPYFSAQVCSYHVRRYVGTMWAAEM